MSKFLKLQVTVKHGHALTEVADQLVSHGFKIDQMLNEIDVIVGSAPRAALAKLSRVLGVTDVAEQPQIDIGPPESGQTW